MRLGVDLPQSSVSSDRFVMGFVADYSSLPIKRTSVAIQAKNAPTANVNPEPSDCQQIPAIKLAINNAIPIEMLNRLNAVPRLAGSTARSTKSMSKP